MRLAEVTREVSNQLSDTSERYQVPQRLRAAGEAARQGAQAAYRMALDHPRTSVAGIILAAALVGGLLWYMFGNSRRPVQRRQSHTRVRAGAERRRRGGRAARARAATA
jgi:hypothetical protein